jgi:hypothetical protein
MYFIFNFVNICCTSLQNIKISRHFLCRQLILDQQEIYHLWFNFLCYGQSNFTCNEMQSYTELLLSFILRLYALYWILACAQFLLLTCTLLSEWLLVCTILLSYSSCCCSRSKSMTSRTSAKLLEGCSLCENQEKQRCRVVQGALLQVFVLLLHL